MPTTKDQKFAALNSAIEIAKKAGEGGGLTSAHQFAGVIRDCYKTIIEITEEANKE
jgi:hypothetical protein